MNHQSNELDKDAKGWHRCIVPSWDGDANTWVKYQLEAAWYITKGWKEDDRWYAVSRLVRRLEESMKKLAETPYIRRALPNAGSMLDEFFTHKRDKYEVMGDYIMKEQPKYWQLLGTLR